MVHFQGKKKKLMKVVCKQAQTRSSLDKDFKLITLNMLKE